MLKDLENDCVLIHLSGEEGSGKTLLCHKLREQMRSSREVVLLGQPAGAFDDLARVLALALGNQQAEQMTGAPLFDSVLQQLAVCAESGRPVLLVVDDAERLFLAALERLLRLVCDAQQRCAFHLVLSGRPALKANLDQLAATCAETLQQSTYVLPPLELEETAAYLAYRLGAAGMSPDRQGEVFSPEATQSLRQETRGNIRLINILAEESLRNSCEGKSFMVLLDHVKTSSELTPAERISISRPTATRRPARKRLAAQVALVTLAVASTFYVLFGANKPSRRQAEAPTAAPPAAQSIPAPVAPGPAVNVPAAVPSASSADGPFPVDSGTKAQPPPPPAAMPVPAAPAAPAVTPQAEANPGTITILPAQEPAGQAGRKPEAKASRKHISGGKLFDERERASRNWLAGGLRGNYTIQVMMLTAPTAEKNIRQLLNEDAFQEAREQLYILRKKASPPTIFIYYGIYPTIQEARLARNHLPVAMRKHHPYPLAITDALRKSGE